MRLADDLLSPDVVRGLLLGWLSLSINGVDHRVVQINADGTVEVEPL